MTAEWDTPRQRYCEQVWLAWLDANARSQDDCSSSAEWDLMCTWHDQGIPLRVVLRGMQDCLRSAPRRPASLMYLGPAVKEAAEHWRKALA